jgi:hypothetical protein
MSRHRLREVNDICPSGCIPVYGNSCSNNMDNAELRIKIESIEKNLIKKDEEIQTIFKILKELLVQEPPPAREPIGFKIPKK